VFQINLFPSILLFWQSSRLPAGRQEDTPMVVKRLRVTPACHRLKAKLMAGRQLDSFFGLRSSVFSSPIRQTYNA
jgi:hypothetical protein